MFVYGYDIVEATAVMLFTGKTNTDADYELYIRTFVELDRKVTGREAPIGIAIVDAGNETPNPIWRKRIAEAAGGLVANPLFILVSGSPVVRGILRAMNWIRPFPMQTAATGTFGEAVLLAEKYRGRRLPHLLELHHEVRAAATGSIPKMAASAR